MTPGQVRPGEGRVLQLRPDEGRAPQIDCMEVESLGLAYRSEVTSNQARALHEKWVIDAYQAVAERSLEIGSGLLGLGEIVVDRARCVADADRR